MWKFRGLNIAETCITVAFASTSNFDHTAMNGHSNGVSLWKKVEMGPPDSILGLVEAFNKDTSPDKVSLAVGAYRDDDGKPWVLPSVRKAEERVIAANMNKEYAPIVGVMDFVTSARAFALGADSIALKEERVASVQSLSGTGACRVIAEFYSKFLGAGTPIYLPQPSWGNRTR